MKLYRVGVRPALSTLLGKVVSAGLTPFWTDPVLDSFWTNALVIVARRLARVIWRHLTDDRGFTKRAPKPVSPSDKPCNAAKSTKTRKAAKASA